MIDVSLDSEGDLLIDDYDLVLIDELDQTIQNATIRLRFFLGEWYLDTSAGVSYYEDFFIKAPNQIRIENVIKQEILDTDGILEITEFSSEFGASSRSFSVQFSATGDQDEFNLEVEIL